MKVAELGSQQTVFNPLQNRLKMKKGQVALKTAYGAGQTLHFRGDKTEEAKDVFEQVNAIIDDIYSTNLFNKDRFNKLGDELKKICEEADENQLFALYRLFMDRAFKKEFVDRKWVIKTANILYIISLGFLEKPIAISLYMINSGINGLTLNPHKTATILKGADRTLKMLIDLKRDYIDDYNTLEKEFWGKIKK